MKKYFALVLFCMTAVGCAGFAEKTNTLSDEKILSQSGGALGYPPDELTLVSRRTEGTNTYVVIDAKDGQSFSCIINGGNFMTMGMVNPPMCNKKGESTNPGGFVR